MERKRYIQCCCFRTLKMNLYIRRLKKRNWLALMSKYQTIEIAKCDCSSKTTTSKRIILWSFQWLQKHLILVSKSFAFKLLLSYYWKIKWWNEDGKKKKAVANCPTGLFWKCNIKHFYCYVFIFINWYSHHSILNRWSKKKKLKINAFSMFN